MKVHVVHGIMDPVGQAGLLHLVPYLQDAGFECRVPDYGLVLPVGTNVVNPLIWRTLRPYIEPGDLYVGHSNGCAIGYDALRDGAPLAGLVLIDAALERHIELPPGVWADVYFNEGDTVTEAARIAAALGIDDPVWGEMGHAGYDGTDRAVMNIDCGHPPPPRPPVSGHSDIFTPEKLRLWAPFIVASIAAHLQGPAAA